MIHAVLFDLDSTLLDVDVGNSFMEQYTRFLAEQLVPQDVERGLAVLAGAMYSLLASEAHAETNQGWLRQRLGDERKMPLPEIQGSFKRIVGKIAAGMGSRRDAATEAHLLIRQVHERGLKVVMATMPIYPRDLITERLRWAGVRPWISHVACLEANRRSKLHRSYFVETSSAVGALPEQCLLVGWDVDQELPALDAGMAVHLLEAPRGKPLITDRLRFGALSDFWSVWADAFG